jgi:hypothetical protein
MNFKKALLAVFGSVLLSTGLLAQEIPGESNNNNPNGPFYPENGTFSPQGTNTLRQFDPNYAITEINSYYGVGLIGNNGSAFRTISVFETSTDDLLMYPNPTAGQVRIRLHEPAPVTAFVFIIDLNGNVVTAWQFPAGSLFLDVSMLALHDGPYSVRVFGPYISYHNQTVVKGQ